MELQVNGEQQTFEADEWTVERLLEALEIEQRQGVAVAVNDRVVTRSQWDAETVSDGDDIEIIRAAQGG